MISTQADESISPQAREARELIAKLDREAALQAWTGPVQVTIHYHGGNAKSVKEAREGSRGR